MLYWSGVYTIFVDDVEENKGVGHGTRCRICLEDENRGILILDSMVNLFT